MELRHLQVLVAESSDLSPPQREAILNGIASRVTKGVEDIKLAPQLSVTLTSTSADLLRNIDKKPSALESPPLSALARINLAVGLHKPRS